MLAMASPLRWHYSRLSRGELKKILSYNNFKTARPRCGCVGPRRAGTALEKVMAFRVFILTLAFLVAASPPAPAQDWQAGAAKINITPQHYMAMSGYGGRDEPANGKVTDLWAKALVIDAGDGQRGVIVTMDLVGIDRDLSLAICQSLINEYEYERRQIVLSTSHTHTGPVVGMNLGPLHYLIQTPEQQELITRYTEELHRKVVRVVGQALEKMQPSRLSWGSGTATFAVNRRENKPYEQAPEWRTAGLLKGPVDHDVPVLAVHNMDGGLTTVLFGYACHATVLSLTQWSGDYPGFAQIDLERSHPGCIAMFWAGCGADQNPLPRRTVELAEHYGKRLALAVDTVLLTSAMTPVSSQLATQYREIEIPLGQLPTRQQIEQDAQSSNRFAVARAKLLLEKLNTGPLDQTYPYPISSWTIGNDLQFIALGGEVVVDYATRLKSELAGSKTWVSGYAHDVMAYIPSRRVLREGGYEGATAMVYYGLPTSWAPEIENMIVSEVHAQLGTHDAR